MTAILTVRGLHARIAGQQVVEDVSFDVAGTGVTALLGRNGVGKTTTLRAVMGLIRKRTGTARFDGRDLLRMPLHHTARAGIGFVPEERGIFSTLSVEENLHLPPVVAPGGMSMDEIFALFPNLKSRRNSQGTKLSGGEQQMLAMARMLRTGVKMLLLDEPTEGLAPVIVQRIGEVLAELKARGMTILLVEQNFRFARRIADRFYVMEHGKITAGFPVAELDGRMALLHDVLGV